MQNVVKLARVGTPLRTRPRSGNRRPLSPETHRRAVSQQFGGVDCIFEVDSPPDLTDYCGWTTDCRFAARRATPSALRATGLVQPPAAARRATALDDVRTCQTGRPRQPQRTLAHCVPAVCPHWHWTGQKANRSRAVSISQPEGQATRLRGFRGLERRA